MPPTRHSDARYITTTTEYLTQWEEVMPIKDYIVDTAARFIFESIISRFGCLKSLTGNQGAHFINEIVASLLKKFLIQHHKSILYHPQANGTVEAFNKILEKGLTKIVSANRDDWDERVPAKLWAYRTTVKQTHKQTLFQLVYGQEVVVPAEFIVPSIFISEATKMIDDAYLKERMEQLMELDESRFLAEFHQLVEQWR